MKLETNFTFIELGRIPSEKITDLDVQLSNLEVRPATGTISLQDFNSLKLVDPGKESKQIKAKDGSMLTLQVDTSDDPPIVIRGISDNIVINSNENIVPTRWSNFSAEIQVFVLSVFFSVLGFLSLQIFNSFLSSGSEKK